MSNETKKQNKSDLSARKEDRLKLKERWQYDMRRINNAGAETIGLAIEDAADMIGSEMMYDQDNLWHRYTTSSVTMRPYLSKAFGVLTGGASYRHEYYDYHKGRQNMILTDWTSSIGENLNTGLTIDIGIAIKEYMPICKTAGQIDALYYVLRCITGYQSFGDLLDMHTPSRN